MAGEGEGSKATLVAWLKRRAEADFGAAVVGRHVWVCWCADAEYYMGEIISYSRENGKHKVSLMCKSPDLIWLCTAFCTHVMALRVCLVGLQMRGHRAEQVSCQGQLSGIG